MVFLPLFYVGYVGRLCYVAIDGLQSYRVIRCSSLTNSFVVRFFLAGAFLVFHRATESRLRLAAIYHYRR